MRISFKSLPVRLLIAIVVGIVVGLISNDAAMNVISSVRHLAGQIVLFSVPLIIVAFVAPSIARMGSGASKLLGISMGMAYASVIGAATLATVVGYLLIPSLSIPAEMGAARELPEMLFELNIPQIIPPMSALVLALLLGLAVAWTKATQIGNLLEEFHKVVLKIVQKIIIPILPLFIAAVFAQLAFQGRITEQLPVFIQAVAIIVVAQLVWLAVLYLVGAISSQRNPMDVIRHYGAPYMTAFGTMSSAATLPVAIEAANKSTALDKKAVDFGIPLFAHVHMPGSVISISLLVLTVSQVLTGALPSVATMALFIVLLGFFAVAAPGVPGGVLTASLGLITAVLGFEEVGIALMLAIFALENSTATATNIAGDGALTMILSKFTGRRGVQLPDAAEDVFIPAPVASEGLATASPHVFDEATLAALDASLESDFAEVR